MLRGSGRALRSRGPCGEGLRDTACLQQRGGVGFWRWGRPESGVGKDPAVGDGRWVGLRRFLEEQALEMSVEGQVGARRRKWGEVHDTWNNLIACSENHSYAIWKEDRGSPWEARSPSVCFPPPRVLLIVVLKMAPFSLICHFPGSRISAVWEDSLSQPSKALKLQRSGHVTCRKAILRCIKIETFIYSHSIFNVII